MRRESTRPLDRINSPHLWILGPDSDDDWRYVPNLTHQFIHHEDVTYHIGLTEEGELIADSRRKEYARPHEFYGNTNLQDIPQQVFVDALDRALGNTAIIYDKRQNFIATLMAHIPGVEDVNLGLPEPVAFHNPELNPIDIEVAKMEAELCLNAIRENFGFQPIN